MKHNKIEIDGSSLAIIGPKAPIFIRIILTLILAILFLIPLVVTFITLKAGNGPHIGIVISYILCWGSGFYLFRVTLWNSVGREVLTFHQDKIDFDFTKEYDSILKLIKEKTSKLFYKNLLKRFQKADSTLTNYELVALQIGYTDNTKYYAYQDVELERRI